MITISDGILTIPESQRFIGFSGDNLHSQKKFFIRNNTQSGWRYRLYLTFDDGRHNFFTLPATVSSEGTWLTWNIEERHIFKSGLIKAQIKAFSDENQVYHTTSDVFVAGKSTEEDEEFQNSNSEFLHFEKVLNELYDEMEIASAKMPYVGTNGNWYTYDSNGGVYLDSGVSSSISLEDMIIPPQKLDRKYWQKLDRIPVADYAGLDAILDEENCSDTIFRLEFSGLSPVKSQVGEGSFVAVSNINVDKLLIINTDNADSWIYEKGSNTLLRRQINGSDINNGTITDDKLSNSFWGHHAVIPATGYDYLEALLGEERNSNTIYRVEFSGLSPIKSKVGEGSFIALANYNSDKLMLVNIENGESWIYHKNTYSIKKLGGSSGIVNLGVINNLDEIKNSRPVEGKIYLINAQGQFSDLSGDGWSFFRYYTLSDANNTGEKTEYIDLFNLSYGKSYKINLTECTAEQNCKIVNSPANAATVITKSGIEYRFTDSVLESLEIRILLPVEKSFECSFVFKSGTTPTLLTCPSFVKWSGDDVASVTSEENGVSVTYNCLVPQANKIYNVIFWYDGFCVNAVARGAVDD